jgi:hypothetical protein
MEYIKQHKLLTGILLVIILGAVWYEFTGSSPSPVLSTANTGNATDTEQAQLVSTLLQLQTVTLNGTILSDPGFMSLQDFTTQVVSEPVGRPNPFAPVSPGSVVEATTSQKIQPGLFAPKTSAH